MPPRHFERSPCHDIRHVADAPCANASRLGLMVGGLILAIGSASVRAQSIPAGPTPVDVFHQPCVAVHLPSGAAADALVVPLGLNAPDGQDVRDVRDVRRLRQYVDLDNRCATPPAFAPTRISDPTSVWHVRAPAMDTGPASVASIASAAFLHPSPPGLPRHTS